MVRIFRARIFIFNLPVLTLQKYIDLNNIPLLRWDGKNAEPVMMSMADGGGSAAGQQVLFKLIICNVFKLVEFSFGDNHLIPGRPACDILIMKLRVSLKCVKQSIDRRTWL